MESDDRVIIHYSVDDAITLLLNCPVQANFFPHLTIVQIMNRVAIAHLSIERALKFLISVSGGSFQEVHDLKKLYAQLRRHEPESAKFLEAAFQASVAHYRYNPNASYMKHLKSLEQYLETSATDQAFQDVRYWELTQSLDEMLLSKVYLTLHLELLCALREVLLEPKRPMETVADRVERTVLETMNQVGRLAYIPGTAKEHSVTIYLRWLLGHLNCKDDLDAAVQNDFKIGDDFAREAATKVYQALLNSNDPAVKYFASSLDVLPTQPRDVIPDVEWHGQGEEQRGLVSAPGGTRLGSIERHADGLWYIAAFKSGAFGLSAKAKTMTDAKCYLAATISRTAQVTVNGSQKKLRIVGDNRELHIWNREQSDQSKASTKTIMFWDKNHGILEGQMISMESRRIDTEHVADKIEGEVLKVQGSAITILGHHVTAIDLSN